MRIARESWPFVVVLGGAGLVAAAAGFMIAAGVALVLLLCVLGFFRDPERVTPGDPATLYSPADGRVIVADAARVSIFLSLFDVHVCRTPAGGRVEHVVHVPGRFLAAFRDEASTENERATITVAGPGVAVRFTLVAGLVARRIVCRVRPGDVLRAGERIGLIRFGSRVDVEVPPGASPAVAVGDRVRAGETAIVRGVALPL